MLFALLLFLSCSYFSCFVLSRSLCSCLFSCASAFVLSCACARARACLFSCVRLDFVLLFLFLFFSPTLTQHTHTLSPPTHSAHTLTTHTPSSHKCSSWSGALFRSSKVLSVANSSLPRRGSRRSWQRGRRDVMRGHHGSCSCNSSGSRSHAVM